MYKMKLLVSFVVWLFHLKPFQVYHQCVDSIWPVNGSLDVLNETFGVPCDMIFPLITLPRISMVYGINLTEPKKGVLHAQDEAFGVLCDKQRQKFPVKTQ